MKVRRLRKTPAHLEITAFINLIVVLVPFLLSTAVFTRLAVIDLALPAQSSDAIFQLDKDKPLKLEIVIRHDGLQVQDRHGGSLTPIGDRIPNVANGPDTKALAVLVQAIKAKFPQHDDATVLAETNTPYETLVKVIDAVRGGHQAQGAKAVRVDYFPNISIGDAPIVQTAAAPAGPMALAAPKKP
jgi:biopolymer transport protein ExbD